jgi:hypothetical protein
MPTAVYRLFSATHALLYVDIACSPERRLAQHAYDKPWWPEVASETIAWYADRREAEAAEMAAIADEKPRYNTLAGCRSLADDVALAIAVAASPVPRRQLGVMTMATHAHVLHPHQHVAVDGKTWCSGRFWCQDCREWVTAKPCAGAILPRRDAAQAKSC